jgi:hypothetical protein
MRWYSKFLTKSMKALFQLSIGEYLGSARVPQPSYEFLQYQAELQVHARVGR